MANIYPVHANNPKKLVNKSLKNKFVYESPKYISDGLFDTSLTRAVAAAGKISKDIADELALKKKNNVTQWKKSGTFTQWYNTKQGLYKQIDDLLQDNYDPSQVDSTGQNAIQIAAHNKDTRSLNLLIAAPLFKPEMLWYNKPSTKKPLEIAIDNEHLEIIEYLFQQNSTNFYDFVDAFGNNVLMKSILKRNDLFANEILKLILNEKDRSEETKNEVIVYLAQVNNDKYTAFDLSILEGVVETIETFFDNEFNLNTNNIEFIEDSFIAAIMNKNTAMLNLYNTINVTITDNIILKVCKSFNKALSKNTDISSFEYFIDIELVPIDEIILSLIHI